MSGDLGKQLETFIEIEPLSSEIYEMLSGLFPESRDFWRYLSTVEKNHALTATIAREYWKLGKLSGDFFNGSFCKLEETLAMMKVVKNRIETEDISFKEILPMILALEESECKKFFRTLMEKQTDLKVIYNLQQLTIDTEEHVNELREFMKGLGLL